MIGKYWRRLLAEVGETHKAVDDIDRRMDKFEVVLMVREPSSTAAAEAYEGLRRQVIGASTERWAHLAQLAQFDAALRYGADGATLRTMVEDWIEQAALDRVADPSHPQGSLLFELVEDLGGALEIVEPAYQDRTTGRVVRRGRTRRGPAAALGTAREPLAAGYAAPSPAAPATDGGV